MPFRCAANTTCVDKTEPPPTCHSERTNVSRGIFPSGKFHLVLVHFPTWWIPPLRLRCGRNDITGGRFYGFAHSSYNVSRRPATLIRLAQASQLPPREALVPCFWGSGFPVRREGKAPRPSPPGKGDRPQAVDEARYGVPHCWNNGRRGRNKSKKRPWLSLWESCHRR